MSDNRTKVIIGLSGVAGTILAYFGVRALMQWIQQRSHDAAYQAQARRRLGGERPTTGDLEGAHVEGTRYQPKDQPDRQPIPTTGMGEVDILEIDVIEEQPVDTSDQASTLVQALLNFENMIQQLRMRRAEVGSDPGTGDIRSLTLGDRRQYQEMVETITDHLQGYAEGNVEADPLQSRIYRLTVKVRDALQNSEYTDADLFRIYGELRSEACQIAAEMPFQADMQHVIELYECQ